MSKELTLKSLALNLNALEKLIAATATLVEDARDVVGKASKAEETEEENEEDDAPKAKAKSKKKPAPVEEDESDEGEEDEGEEDEDQEDEEGDEESDEEDEEPKAKKGGVTSEQVIAAFKKLAKVTSKPDALKFMKKLGQTNVNDFEPSERKAVLAKVNAKIAENE